MIKVKFIGFIPWVTIRGIIGSLFVVSVIPRIVDTSYYKGKYNNNVSQVYQKYIDSRFTTKVVMPSYKSDKVLRNRDKERLPLGGRLRATYDSKKCSSNPSTDYCILFCSEYNKCMNIISLQNVNGNYWEEEVVLAISRDDMSNSGYGTRDNPVSVLRAVGVSEPIWFSGKDTNPVSVNNLCRNNVINYLKCKVPKEEFERRLKTKNRQ